MKKSQITICAALVAAFVATEAKSDTLAEQNYAFGGLGIFQYGDKLAGETLGTGAGVEAGANFNIAPQIDVAGYMYYYSASKNGFTVSGLNIGADASYWFMPKTQINPYAGAGLYLSNVKAEYEYDYGFGVSGKVSDSDNNIGLKVFGGAEFDLDPSLLLRTSLALAFIDGENDLCFSVIGGYKLNEQFTPYARFEYWTDNGDIIFNIGTVFKF